MMNITLVEDRFDGSSNFSSWKSKLQITLEESDLLSLIEKTLSQTTTDEEKVDWKVDDVKARKIIIYLVRDHLLPRIATLKTTYEMFDTLKKMFESNNTIKSLTLKNWLQHIKMTKAHTIATLFMKISKIKDQLGAIGETISNRELVLTTLNALPRRWEPFLQSITSRANLPQFDSLWTDCTQEETKLIARGVQVSRLDDNQALASHARKGNKRSRRSFNKAFKDKKTSATPSHEHRKDNSRIQCFRCDKYGHIARDCPARKKGRQLASTVNVDPEPHQRDEDIKDEAFFFISALSGTVPTNNDIWLIDSGASRHMTGYRDQLIDLVEKESHLHVVLGDNAKYTMKGVGTSTFQLDSDIPLQLSEVLYVPGMKRNLIFVSALEDKRYKVTFSEGKVLAWHKNSHMDYARVIGVRENSLYRLTVRLVQVLLHDTITLSELWHKRLAHLHYRALPAKVIDIPEIAFRRSVESHMGIDSENITSIPSPPSGVQRETITDPADPTAPADVPKDIVVGHKKPVWARQTL
jgi:hypothetical protein